ncbi:hypothetical protein [Candidatus Phytoplasma sacchari]|nr:hypothetical protein [Candidatus Phytoplasma sacchari]KAB8122707.1 hypothetical protein F2B49_00845 [Candidatus Phytoplasma sacchari]
MFPKVKNHSFVLSKKISLEECKKLRASKENGDIITFNNIDKSCRIFHRVIYNNIDEGYVTTMGDNNKCLLLDEEKIFYQDIISKNIFHINFYSLFIITVFVVFYSRYLILRIYFSLKPKKRKENRVFLFIFHFFSIFCLDFFLIILLFVFFNSILNLFLIYYSIFFLSWIISTKKVMKNKYSIN